MSVCIYLIWCVIMKWNILQFEDIFRNGMSRISYAAAVSLSTVAFTDVHTRNCPSVAAQQHVDGSGWLQQYWRNRLRAGRPAFGAGQSVIVQIHIDDISHGGTVGRQQVRCNMCAVMCICLSCLCERNACAWRVQCIMHLSVSPKPMCEDAG